MAPPALAKMASLDNDDAYLKKNDSLYKECYELLFNKQEHLFARDASYLIDAAGKGKLEANGKKIFWSRGNGWVMAGLARLLEEMPADYPQRSFYIGLFQEMAERLLGLQQEDGLWRTSLLDPGAYAGGEGSGSAFFCYSFAWGINHRLLDKTKYGAATLKAWSAINGLVNEEGRYGWVQPIGADPRKNFGPDSWESFGSGAYLLAATEILKLR
jgi:rhamnogalacturonyl hydrolase YesR